MPSGRATRIVQKALVPDHCGSTSQFFRSVPQCNRRCLFQDSAKSFGPRPFWEYFAVTPFGSAVQPEVPFPGSCKKHWSQIILGAFPGLSSQLRGAARSAFPRIVGKALVPDRSGSTSRFLLSVPQCNRKCPFQDRAKSISPKQFWEHCGDPPPNSAVQPEVPFAG